MTYSQEDTRSVQALVAKAHRIMLTSRIVLRVSIWATISLAAWLVLFNIDNALHLPAGLRLAVSVGGFALMAFALWKGVLESVLRREGLRETSLVLERRYSVPENMLVNALCFESGQLRPVERPFADQTIATGLSLMADQAFADLWPRKKILQWISAAILVLLLWIIYGLGWPGQAANALARFALPLSDLPPAGSVVLEVTPSDDVTLAEMENLKVAVRMRRRGGGSGPGSYPEIVWLDRADHITAEADGVKKAAMRPDQEHSDTYSHTFSAVRNSFAFRVRAADTYTRSIKVDVTRVPRIKESQFRITPPAYTGMGVIEALGPPETLSGLPGSKVEINLKLDRQAEAVYWKTQTDEITFDNTDELWRARTTLDKGGSYAVKVKDAEVDKPVAVATGMIIVEQDRVPQVHFEGERSRQVAPGERLKLEIRASDDFGIDRLYVTLQPLDESKEPDEIKTWKYEGPPGEKGPVSESLLLSIDPGTFRTGVTYALEAFCKDFCPANAPGHSEPVLLHVRSLEDLNISEDHPAGQAFAELEAAIRAQQTALGFTANLLSNLDDVIDESKESRENKKLLDKHQNELNNKQTDVGAHLTRAWDVSSPPRPHFVERMIALRDGEHTRIVGMIKDIDQTDASSKSAVSADLTSIERLQKYVLEQLIALKGIAAKEIEDQNKQVLAEILGESEQLAPSADDVLEKTVDELKDFTQKQKQIMEKRAMIMDKPAEDFSSSDEEELDNLAIDQSKLAEILSNAVNDLTNTDLLDFGDDAIVDSMKSIYEQAEDLAALAAEAADNRQARVDAHRLETEAVEMAEELMINCEATLAGHDNIQFIAEIPEDEQLFAPLAELPSELEDLVGDLIKSEEDMREEVEDIGSYLNSLDHTAGPIGDGTISSTSAKGKTGNQRPEDNVIQGRSGAGRSGMSDGQLVEPVAKALEDNDYALRERPSNTPLEAGQVKDEDTEAQTGGTGLGKTTDSSSPFGADGKLPPSVLDKMKDAAMKQQSIRETAQEVLYKLNAHNLPTADMDKSTAEMQHLEQALANADGVGIRRAYDQTIDSLRKSRRAVGTQIAIQTTRDKALAEKLSNMMAKNRQYQFEGYETMIGAYFEAVARMSSALGKQNRTGRSSTTND